MDCNYTFEEFQKMSDDPLDSCPSCSGTVKRLIGAGAAPIFKGSGFYQTDYKNSSQNKKPATTADNKAGEKVSKSETNKSK
jgi:putative FmdB family regulatory protein